MEEQLTDDQWKERLRKERVRLCAQENALELFDMLKCAANALVDTGEYPLFVQDINALVAKIEGAS